MIFSDSEAARKYSMRLTGGLIAAFRLRRAFTVDRGESSLSNISRGFTRINADPEKGNIGLLEWFLIRVHPREFAAK
jgi:hypothetical protein